MSFYHLNPKRRGEKLARALERNDNYRVLRRLPEPHEIWCRSMPVPGDTFTIGVIDVETNGLDFARHKVIELAVGTLTFDLEGGDVVDVTPPQAWLEDPGEDLPIEIERLTHITSNMLVGQKFDDAAITAALNGVGALVAHNAPFDREFVTRRFPAAAALPWCCSMREVDWSALGFGSGRSIESLLTQAGFFLPDAHRASADAWATICLLTLSTNGGQSVASRLIDTASRTTYRLYAQNAPFSCKDVLKGAGYRWSVIRRAWWIEDEAERIDNEAVWLRQLSPVIVPQREEITWLERHA